MLVNGRGALGVHWEGTSQIWYVERILPLQVLEHVEHYVIVIIIFHQNCRIFYEILFDFWRFWAKFS